MQTTVDWQPIPWLYEIGRPECARGLEPCLSYCRDHVDSPPSKDEIAEVFRSERLSEAAARVFPQSCATPYSPQMTQAFATFLAERTALIDADRPRDHDALVRSEVERPRSLLITEWAGSLFDGALTPETDGFLNDDAMSPWDTWLALIRVQGAESGEAVALLSWVPVWMAEDVDRSVFIDAAECLSWARFDSHGRLTVNGWGRRWDAEKQ